MGELARETGIAASAVRYYESLGLVKSSRTSGGQRQYEADAVVTMRTIAFARTAGFTLAEIAALGKSVDEEGPLFQNWKTLAEKKLAELDEVIARAQEMKRHLRQGLDCVCRTAETCPLISPAPTEC